MEATRWEYEDRTVDLRCLIWLVAVFRWTRPRSDEPDGLVNNRDAS